MRRPPPRSPDLPIPRSPDPPIPRSADPPISRSPDPPISRSPDPPIPRSPDFPIPPIPRSPDPPIPRSPVLIHPSAIVDPGAEIGEGTKIWHFCHVMPGARIGCQCSLGQNVYVANNVVIGDHVKIQNNVSIYEGVVLEDYVFCGPSMVFTNIRTPRSAYPRNTSADCVPTRVKHGASIGANATVVCGVTIGAWALIGAGAVVTKGVPDYALVTGVPGRVAGWVSQAGLTLKFEAERAVCAQTGQVYVKRVGGLVERIESGGGSGGSVDR